MSQGIMRRFLSWLAKLLVTSSQLAALAEEPLPVGSHPQALESPHFPDRLHEFVWRNWELVEPSTLASVVGTSTKNIVEIATSMGLPSSPSVEPDMQGRGYITLIRRNWHLLPYEQLLQLVEMTADELYFTLNEDDFLYIKLGSLKPKCEPLRYAPPDAQARQRAAEIKQVVEATFGNQLSESGEPRFSFAEQLAQLDQDLVVPEKGIDLSEEKLRYVHSYFGSFGDFLSNEASDPFPEGYLQKLASVGVNGVWMHVVLRDLTPGGEHFPEFGSGHRLRLANLRRLAEKTRKYGIGIYLYMNEPRAMPADFFKDRPDLAGIPARGLRTMCTSRPQVRQWMTDALAHLFREVPDLAGVFTITASENPTNCAYGGGHAECPHCRERSQAEIVTEVNAAIEEGVHRGNPKARVIAWDWGWNGHGDATETIAMLPDNVEFMSVSEWSLPIERGGVSGTIGEYSLSAVGPGPRATRHWKVAKERGLKTVAKVQLNNSWEFSPVPFLPVLDLVAEHCENLAKADVDGTMLSWSLGGYPSPNLQVAHEFATMPEANREDVLDAVALQRYGASAVPHIRRAWTAFSDGFREFPYSGAVVYFGPQHMGPANLLYGDPTEYKATMVGMPYDNLDRWTGQFPPEVFAEQFEKMVEAWETGLDYFQHAVTAAEDEKRTTVESDFGLAQVIHLHFASVANQTRFVLAREALRSPDLESSDREELLKQLAEILDDEIRNATELYKLTKKDSRIGFEASNHYFYVPLDLVEKVVNCEYLKTSLSR